MNNGFIKLLIYSFILFSILISGAGCAPSYSREDTTTLNALKEKYGDTFKLEFDGEFYLKVELKKDIKITQEELIEIYKMFSFYKETNKRRKTSFVYLNYYDFMGKFQYQISYDQKTNNFIRSSAEHY